MPTIILADHDDSQFWRYPIDIAVIQSPNYVLGTIAADSEIKGISRCVVPIPNAFPDSIEALNDGISNIDKVDLPLASSCVD